MGELFPNLACSALSEKGSDIHSFFLCVCVCVYRNATAFCVRKVFFQAHRLSVACSSNSTSSSGLAEFSVLQGLFS